MCGRFTQNYTWPELNEALSVIGPPRNLWPRYNIAPTTTIDVVRSGEGGNEVASMRWGLCRMVEKAAEGCPGDVQRQGCGYRRSRTVIPI